MNWSGRRDSNPRLQPWQGCALPLSYARLLLIYLAFYEDNLKRQFLRLPIGRQKNSIK